MNHKTSCRLVFGWIFAILKVVVYWRVYNFLVCEIHFDTRTVDIHPFVYIININKTQVLQNKFQIIFRYHRLCLRLRTHTRPPLQSLQKKRRSPFVLVAY